MSHYPQEGQDGGSGELEAGQSQLSPWGGHITNQKIPLHFTHRENKGKSCLSFLNTFCDDSTASVVEGREADIIFLDSSKAFDTVFFSMFIAKLVRYGLDKWMIT